jgi:hypothetical protein
LFARAIRPRSPRRSPRAAHELRLRRQRHALGDAGLPVVHHALRVLREADHAEALALAVDHDRGAVDRHHGDEAPGQHRSSSVSKAVTLRPLTLRFQLSRVSIHGEPPCRAAPSAAARLRRWRRRSESARGACALRSTLKSSASRMSCATPIPASSRPSRAREAAHHGARVLLQEVALRIWSVMRHLLESEPSGSDEFGSKYTVNGFSTGST